jgi:hypothetical protein
MLLVPCTATLVSLPFAVNQDSHTWAVVITYLLVGIVTAIIAKNL